MSSFWSNNSSAPSWTEYIKAKWNNYPPRLLNHQNRIPFTPVPNCILKKASESELVLLPEFLNRYYSVSSSCKCYLPLSHIQNMVRNNSWEVYVVLNNSLLIGCVIRRWISDLSVKGVIWKKAAIVDYFCVHPAWRKRGIGRWLLQTLQNSLQPLPPHLILWEGLNPSYPPLSVGFFWSFRTDRNQKTISNILPETDPTTYNSFISSEVIHSKKQSQIFTELRASTQPLFPQGGTETQLFRTPYGYILVWDTFHRSIPDGAKIGIIMKGSEKAIQYFSSSKENPFGILLATHSNPFSFLNGWTLDSPYQWISYNMIVGHTEIGTFPCLSL